MSDKLDLHGVKHEDVHNTVKRFVEDHWADYGARLEIITGHSEQMMKLVETELDRYGLSHYREPAVIMVDF